MVSVFQKSIIGGALVLSPIFLATNVQANDDKLFENITTPEYSVPTLISGLTEKGKCTDDILFNPKAKNSGICSLAILGAVQQLGNAFYNGVNNGTIGTKSKDTAEAMKQLREALDQKNEHYQKNKRSLSRNRPHLEDTARIALEIIGSMHKLEKTIETFWNRDTSSKLEAIGKSIKHGKAYNYSPLTGKAITPR